MVERNAGLPPERRIEFRVGIHLGDVVEESDGDLMGDGVNIAARLEGIADPGGICLSEDAYRQVSRRPDVAAPILVRGNLRTLPASESLFGQVRRACPRAASFSIRKVKAAAPLHCRSALRQYRRRPGAGILRRWRD